jgi:hypothetical protein
MEFFETECGVEFVDVTTSKRALDIISEQAKPNPFDDPQYKSDYDRFLEETRGGEIYE